jgi:hypothetical protein
MEERGGGTDQSHRSFRRKLIAAKLEISLEFNARIYMGMVKKRR